MIIGRQMNYPLGGIIDEDIKWKKRELAVIGASHIMRQV